LLEASIDGCTEAIMLAYGFKTELLMLTETEIEHDGKRLELVREMLPGASRIAVLVNPANTANRKMPALPQDFRFRSSMRGPAGKSIQPSRHSPAIGPTPSSSGKTHFSMGGASSSRIGRRGMRCR
jgi:hypothetical protein